jgi:predicted nucleic acid-binding protein
VIAALDTNFLVYLEGINDVVRQQAAETIMARLGMHKVRLPAQVLMEFINVVVRKARWPARRAEQVVRAMASVATVLPTTPHVLEDALSLMRQHGLGIFDCVIVAASASARADLLLSEDMQDGFVWRGLTVVNPFAATPHPLLTALLR